MYIGAFILITSAIKKSNQMIPVSAVLPSIYCYLFSILVELFSRLRQLVKKRAIDIEK